MMRFIFSLLTVSVFALLTACSTHKYTNHDAERYVRYGCEITENPCNFDFGKEGFLSYSVEKTGANEYRVFGEVELDLNVVGGMHPRVSFYVLFMDGQRVHTERRVYTGTKKATFDFTITAEAPVERTAIQKILFHTWS